MSLYVFCYFCCWWCPGLICGDQVGCQRVIWSNGYGAGEEEKPQKAFPPQSWLIFVGYCREHKKVKICSQPTCFPCKSDLRIPEKSAEASIWDKVISGGKEDWKIWRGRSLWSLWNRVWQEGQPKLLVRLGLALEEQKKGVKLVDN